MAPPASLQLQPRLLEAVAWRSFFCPVPHLSIGRDAGTALLARILLCATPPSTARWNSFAWLHPLLCHSTLDCSRGRLGSAPPFSVRLRPEVLARTAWLGSTILCATQPLIAQRGSFHPLVRLHPRLLSGTASTLFCATPPQILGGDSLARFHPLLWDSTLDCLRGRLGSSPSTLFCGTPPLILGRDGLAAPPSSVGLRP